MLGICMASIDGPACVENPLSWTTFRTPKPTKEIHSSSPQSRKLQSSTSHGPKSIRFFLLLSNSRAMVQEQATLALVALCGSLGVGQGQGPCASSMQCCTGWEAMSGDTCSCSWAFRPLWPCTGLDALLCCPGSSWCQYAEQGCCQCPQGLSSSQHWRLSTNTKPPQAMRLC